MTKILLPNFIKLPDSATFDFKYGKFYNVSIRKWPFGYRDLYIYGVMEKDELYFWKKFIDDGDIVIDVGANFGYWTMVASKLVGTSGKVISFEPIDTTYKIISKNITTSKLKNVDLYKVGLSNENKQATFHISSMDGIGGSSTQGLHSVVNFNQEQEVTLVSLDTFINLKKPISLIKLDIEGGELFALYGMEKIIKSDNPILTFEWNILTSEGMGYHPEKIVRYLKTLNYEINIVKNKKLIQFNSEIYPKEQVLMLWALPISKKNM